MEPTPRDEAGLQPFTLDQDVVVPMPSAADVERVAVALERPQASLQSKAASRLGAKCSLAREILVSNGVSRTDEQRLRDAANHGDYSAVMRLLEQGVDANCADDRKRTALHFASCKGDRAIIDLLLSHGADPNCKDSLGNNPLHLAACTSHMEVITALVKGGTDISMPDNLGRTPMNYALSHLRLLQKWQERYSTEEYRGKILSVVNLLQEYLGRTGNVTDRCQVDALGNRLMCLSSRESVDEISVLLASLTSLAVDSQQGQRRS